MKPTEILKAEHRVIERVLASLEVLTTKALKAGKLEADAAAHAVDFFRNFADRCHHGKEEAKLFPALEAKGFSPEDGPTAVMRAEHEQGRAYVRVLAESLAAAGQGDAQALKRFAQAAQGYVDLLRQHIQKEDHCLFAMADSALSADEQLSLLEAFERIEHEDLGAGTHEKFLKIAEDLCRRYGLAVPEAAEPALSCCHHHKTK
jgi:hemerythrin-like domain-containing protein